MHLEESNFMMSWHSGVRTQACLEKAPGVTTSCGDTQCLAVPSSCRPVRTDGAGAELWLGDLM